MSQKTIPIHRPRIIILVAVILAIYSVIPLLIGIAGLVSFISAILDQSTSTLTSNAFAFVVAFGGFAAFVMFFRMAWLFYSLKRNAYIMVKYRAKVGMYGFNTDWLLWLATNRGKRLDDKDVRDAFGLKEYDIF